MLVTECNLALQLRFMYELCPFDVGEASFGLMGAAPERPGNDTGGLDAPLCEFDGDAADFLDRPSDQVEGSRLILDRRLVFLAGVFWFCSAFA